MNITTADFAAKIDRAAAKKNVPAQDVAAFAHLAASICQAQHKRGRADFQAGAFNGQVEGQVEESLMVLYGSDTHMSAWLGVRIATWADDATPSKALMWVPEP